MEKYSLIGRNVLKAEKPPNFEWSEIGKIIKQIMPLHEENAEKIDYLHKFYRSNQPIKKRKKEVRSDITYNIVVNYAYRVVDFYVGYTLSNNIQFLPKNIEKSELIESFNSFYDLDDGHNKNIKIGEWCFISGNGYKRILPNRNADIDSAPYKMQVLDPKNTFIVYSEEDETKICAGTIATKKIVKEDKEEKNFLIGVYTDKKYFEWELSTEDIDKIDSTPPKFEGINGVGIIPIVEYMNNHNRIGLVEVALDLFNAINLLGSNASEGIEQIVQAYLILINAQLPLIDPNDPNSGKQLPKTRDIISIGGPKGNSDAKFITSVLDQSHVKILWDIYLDALGEITGVPLISSRGQAVSGGTTGHAEQTRGGWGHADTKAIKFLKLFRSSTMESCRIILNIARGLQDVDIAGLTLREIEIKPTRSKFANMQSIAQSFSTIHNTGVFAPEDSAKMVDLSDDISGAIERGKEWNLKQNELYKEMQYKLEKLKKLEEIKEQDEVNND